MRREVLEHVQQMMSLRISTFFAEKMRARGYHGTIEIDHKLKQLKISVSWGFLCCVQVFVVVSVYKVHTVL